MDWTPGIKLRVIKKKSKGAIQSANGCGPHQPTMLKRWACDWRNPERHMPMLPPWPDSNVKHKKQKEGGRRVDHIINHWFPWQHVPAATSPSFPACYVCWLWPPGVRGPPSALWWWKSAACSNEDPVSFLDDPSRIEKQILESDAQKWAPVSHPQ